MNPRPGEVWLADLGLAAKTRPGLNSERARDRFHTTVRLERKLGNVSNDVLAQIKAAMSFALDL